jgi:SWI/SNF-related matrix-associated actin-dependent regulator 1 of chromatin subfamily A
MAKKQSDSQKNPVNIRKLKANYELRYDFNKMLSEFIKSLPKEHRTTRKDSVINADGVAKDEWVRSIREYAMGNVVNFMVDNGIPFTFQNVPEDDINKLRQEYLDRQKRLSEILRLKAEQLSVEDDDYSFLKQKPYNYQKQAVKFFEINDGKAILGDQPGVGKSLSAIAYAVKHQYKTLVICPSSLKLNWRKEINDFTNEKTFVYKYAPKKRSKDVAFKKDESLFHVINYESLDSYIKIEYKHKCKGKMVRTAGNGMVDCDCEIINLNKTQTECPQCKNKKSFRSTFHSLQFFEDGFGESLNPEDYDLIVIDESHRIKEKKTGWTQAIVRAFRDVIPRKILISGTAIKSRPSEFFTSLNFLNKDEWNNQHEFGVKYCAGYDTGFGWDYSGVSNLEQLFTRISGIFLRRLKKDVLKDLPPKTYTNMPIELTDAEYKEYEQILKSFKKEDKDGKSVEESYLAKIAKLKLFTGRCKLKRAIDYIQDIIDGGEKVVIMSDLQELAEEVHKLFPKISVLHTGSMNENDKFESYQNFQNNKDIKVFSGMIMASGVGISLTEASRLIFLGFGWTPGDMEQAEDRIHRASTTHDNIQIITLYCVGTTDEDIMELLEEKSAVVQKVLDNNISKKDIKSADESIFKSLMNRIKEK